MHQDAHIARWSRLLCVLAAVAALFTIASPLYAFSHECRITLFKGQDLWRVDFFALRTPDFITLLGIGTAPKLVWLAALWEILRLGRRYQQGHIFDEPNARRLVRIGGWLAAIGALNCLMRPAINYFLYWRGISPWLGDMPLSQVVQPNYLMAGLFFVIFGNVMRRAIELQEHNRLIV